MEKKYYIQPSMSVQNVLADMNVMLLNSNSGLEPGMQNSAPKIVPHVNIHTADTVQVF